MAAPNFLQNQDPLGTPHLLTAARGPFDGQLGAVVQLGQVDYLVTTHADYIPEPPAIAEHDVFLRKDLRYGTDDFVLWPQRFSQRYCHLGVVRTTAATPITEIMWWDPALEDFITVQDGRTITEGFGHLSDARLGALSKALDELILDYKAYIADAPQNKVPSSLSPLILSLRAALDRLQVVPCSFDQMVLAIRNMQRTFLEADAMIEYMRVYKPRMEDPLGEASRPQAGMMGAYTGNAREAQLLHRAGIPYWYIRQASQFSKEKINELVAVRLPSHLELQAHVLHPTLGRATGNTDAKLEMIQKCSLSAEWYTDPYDSASPLPSVADSSPASGSRDGGPSRSRDERNHERYSPYKRNVSPQRSHQTSPVRPPVVNPPTGRDKFIALGGRPEMPATIPHWEKALAAVDRSRPPLFSNTYYVLPEPALLASPEDVGQRQLRLHHFLMLHDALLYRIAHLPAPKVLISSQEWRDILAGKVTTQGRDHTKQRQRTNKIDELLRPALVASGIHGQRDFPADRDKIAPISDTRAQEIIWEVAETNFRFEFVALDKRASGRYHTEECTRCFAGGMLMRIPTTLGRRGLASTDLHERHPCTVRLARLMCDWKVPRVDTPRDIREAPSTHCWTETQMRELELTVAKHYTQVFYLLFGRAAVIPMRLEHAPAES
ncbi:hypothetical protein B0H12DRAFT_1075305 [Mycena haematopus]|nr:hypothetical protein B0H12DRAFT_1075305 [Mycena haematopus]